MVVVNGVTYSCSKCITGHRATKCQHHDRELSEIKKKGRPIGCLSCSELRRTKSIHAKCSCIKEEIDSETQANKKRKTLKDVLDAVTNPAFNSFPAASTSQLPYISTSSTSITPLSGLLNLCRCGKGGFCVECTVTPLAKVRSSPSSSACCSKPPPSTSTNQSQSQAQTSPSSYQLSELETFLPPPSRTSSGSSSISISSNNSSKMNLNRDQLFIPSTLGTLSCFCGDSCSCPGCNTHDPSGRKFSGSGSSSSISIGSTHSISASSISSILEVVGNMNGKGKGNCEENREEGGACKCSIGGQGRISTNDILVGPPTNGITHSNINGNGSISTILTDRSGIEVLITAATSTASSSSLLSSSLLPSLPLVVAQIKQKPNNLRTDLPSFEQLLKLVNQEDLLLQKRSRNYSTLPPLSPLPSPSSSSHSHSHPHFLNPLPSLTSLPSSLSYLLSPPSKLISLPPQASSSSSSSSTSTNNRIMNNLDFGSMSRSNLLLKNPICSVLDPELAFDGGCVGGECLCSSGGCGCKD